MRSTVKLLIAVTLALAVGSVAAGASPADTSSNPDLVILVRVYNYAHVPRPLWSQAEKEASRIFAAGGVHILWRDCSLDATEAQVRPGCHRELAPTDNVLRLQARFQGGLTVATQDTLGFVPMTEGGRGAYASIFLDRVAALADGKSFSPSLILGHAIAHELGHLWLRSVNHSPQGIMQVTLGPEELKRARIGRLLFTPEQYGSMRDEIRSRAGGR